MEASRKPKEVLKHSPRGNRETRQRKGWRNLYSKCAIKPEPWNEKEKRHEA